MTRLLAGESLDDCLGRYESLAAELRPMLEVASGVRGVSSQVTEAGRLRSRSRFLTAAAQLSAPRQSRSA